MQKFDAIIIFKVAVLFCVMMCNQSFTVFSEWMNDYAEWNPFGCELLRANDTGVFFTWALTLVAVCIYCTQAPVISEDECCGLSRWKVVTCILFAGFIAGTLGGFLYVGISIGLLLTVVIEVGCASTERLDNDEWDECSLKLIETMSKD